MSEDIGLFKNIKELYDRIEKLEQSFFGLSAHTEDALLEFERAKNIYKTLTITTNAASGVVGRVIKIEEALNEFYFRAGQSSGESERYLCKQIEKFQKDQKELTEKLDEKIKDLDKSLSLIMLYLDKYKFDAMQRIEKLENEKNA